jgi:L-serine dehydratase
MNLFDIIGPVMVGPSSSHTAGAVRIGNIARKLLGEEVKKAEIYFHGSFEMTGKGHGTDKALLAGLMGLAVDDSKIPNSFDVALERGLSYEIKGIDLGDAHPNSVKMKLVGVNGKEQEVVACSVGGGQIQIREINGLSLRFSGDYPTLIIRNQDIPGQVQQVTAFLAKENVNIGTMQLYRSARGADAVMVIECDKEVPNSLIPHLEELGGIVRVTYLSLKEDNV